MSNIFDIEDEILDQYIYRVISIDRLYELFLNCENVLVKPILWDDPFENFILNSKVRLPSGEFAGFGFRNDFYGQCWTLHKASDAMWRIYSPDKKSVRIRTTIRKLLNSLENTLGELASVQSFIGKVRYLPNKKLMQFAKTVFKGVSIPNAKLFAQTLLIKRPAFVHEKEVRLLYFEQLNDITKVIHRYSINPHDLIDQIMIDPRLLKSDAETVKAEIIKTTGFKGPIKRSLLYAVPENLIFPFG